MKNTNKTLALLFAALIVLGFTALLVGIPLWHQWQSPSPEDDASAARRPRYNPWGALAGIGACLCVLVFIKSMIDWWDRRDRRKSAICPDCRGSGNMTDNQNHPCKTCAGTGRIHA